MKIFFLFAVLRPFLSKLLSFGLVVAITGLGQLYAAIPPPIVSLAPAGATISDASPRIIVKLRSTSAKNLSFAMLPTSNAVDMTKASAADPGLASLLTKHSVRAVSPVFAALARAKTQAVNGGVSIKSKLQQRFPLRASRAQANETFPDLSGTYLFELGQNRTVSEIADAVRSLRADPNVLFAEEDKVVRVAYIPNDPSYSSTGSWNQSYDDLYGLKKINTAQAWDVTQGEGVVVAVVDTGIDYNHPDIRNNIWHNSGEIPGNGIDDDHNGYVDDTIGWDFVGSNSSVPTPDNDPYDGYFHGTHVAGTIAATGDNNLGVVGVAWKAKVMAVKALDDTGIGYDSDLAKAIVYAVDNGADVINASWGREGTSQSVSDAIDYAHAAGVVFVAAAGNSQSDAKDFSPANSPSAIAVSSLDPLDNPSYFSNFGSKVELSAPGEDILSLQSGTSGYVRLSGTSMAAPHVSGVAALIIAQHPTFSNEQIRQALRVGATDFGALGKDSSYGYGRVNAAQSVLIGQPLEAKILSPGDGVTIVNSVALVGSSGGAGFDHYVVDFTSSVNPGVWTTLRNSNVSVVNGSIGSFDPTTLSDGLYTVRLRAFTSGGAVFSDQIQIQIRYLEITSPVPPLVPVLTREVRPGVMFDILGSAQGPSFKDFVLEWAPGADAVSGWATTGFVLAGAGKSPVVESLIGSWTPPSSASGYYTIRLTANNTGFSSMVTTEVYVEPALMSNAWPKLVAAEELPPRSVLPVRQPDGTTRLLFGGYPSDGNSLCYLFALDGSFTTAPLGFVADRQPCVGNLDGKPGDEIVVADGYSFKVFSSDLNLIRTIVTAPKRAVWVDQTILADLDNDGVPEIIAPVRDTQAGDATSYRESGALCVYRADGTPFPGNYPVTITSPLSASGGFDGFYGVRVVAADLNGDGRKEIVMAVTANDNAGYSLLVLNADGTPYAGWASTSFPGFLFKSLAAADLDHDGKSELVIVETNQAGDMNQVRVLNGTGAVRSGWPVVLDWGISLAIADLDRDGRNEIVSASYAKMTILRDDGTLWNQPWQVGSGVSANFSNTPIIADVDNDGSPEIFVISNPLNYTGSRRYFDMSLLSYSPNGTLLKSWPLFGVDGRQAVEGVPLIGDFNSDGRTDIIVQTSLIEGGDVNGYLVNSALTCLTLGTVFNPSASDWVSDLHDPQNSSTLNPFAGARFSHDFNGDGHPDILWQNPSTGERFIWLMVGVQHVAGASLGMVDAQWSIAATADFNGDGQTDILWQNTVTGERYIWFMSGAGHLGGASLGIVSTQWSIAAAADFNDDGRPDILWQNASTGERFIWFMSGAQHVGGTSLGVVNSQWLIAATADFNSDGQTDILWQNPSSGERYVWFMRGAGHLGDASLGVVNTQWSIAAAADFSDDGHPDILWQNTTTGQRYLWLMNGTAHQSDIDLGIVDENWKMVK